jgi:Holliday junction DNA helicase RuvB
MRSKKFDFIGQDKIVLELSSIYNELKNKKIGVNILLTGFAGCGKTKLAKEFLSLFGDFGIQFPKNTNKFKLFWDGRCEDFRGFFFDEIHLFKNVEELYPILDRKEKIIVLATNILDLPDALTSRCFILTFEAYSKDEIAKIIYEYSRSKKFPIEMSVADVLASFSRGSPRVAINIFDRALFILKRHYYSYTIKGFCAALKDIGIYEGGFTDLDLKYLSLLKKHKFMSLDNLSRMLLINKVTISQEIEPFLMDKGLIEITSKGRCING